MKTDGGNWSIKSFLSSEHTYMYHFVYLKIFQSENISITELLGIKVMNMNTMCQIYPF